MNTRPVLTTEAGAQLTVDIPRPRGPEVLTAPPVRRAQAPGAGPDPRGGDGGAGGSRARSERIEEVGLQALRRHVWMAPGLQGQSR